MVVKICLVSASLLAIGLAILLNLECMQEYKNLLTNKYLDIYHEILSLPDDTPTTNDRIFTKDELAQYDGTAGSKGLMLAVLGKVFDVSKGIKHYGPDGGYHFFTGKDGSRAFVSGDFTDKGLIEDLEGLNPQEVADVDNWVKFYEKDYTYVGKLVGHFYDSKGQPTKHLKHVEVMQKKAEEIQQDDNADKQRFPPCNSEWSQQNGGRVYCSNRSGGIQRDWVGVPRLYFRLGSKDPRCACVRTTGPSSDEPDSSSRKNRGDLDNPSLKMYKNCSPTSDSCRLPK